MFGNDYTKKILNPPNFKFKINPRKYPYKMQGGLSKHKNKFWMKFPEEGDHNQYWFSKKTIKFLLEQLEKHGKKVAFLSTPSVYFSIKNKELKSGSKLFEVRIYKGFS